MKKRNLATLAVIGISAGLLAGGCEKQDEKKTNGSHATEDASAEMKAFHDSLSEDAQKKFDELDAQHKMMAMEMADQKCNGQNKCAGMGGCESAENKCAGHNGCKGKGGAPVKDADKAIDVQYKNQMDADKNGKAK